MWTASQLKRPYTVVVQTPEGIQEGLIVRVQDDALQLLLVRPLKLSSRARARLDLGGMHGSVDLELVVAQVGSKRLKGAGGSWFFHRVDWSGVGLEDQAGMHEALGVGRAPDPGQVVALHSHSAPSRPAPEPSSMATEPSRRRRPRLPAAPAAHDRLMLEVDARDPGLVGQAVRTSGSRVRLRLRLPEAMTLSPRIRLSVRLGRDTWIQLRGRVARQDGRRLSIECHDVPEDDLWLLTRTPRRSA